LAERWDGGGWKLQRTPNPSGAQASELDGVSCGSASACTAVGDFINDAGTRTTLAEIWDGNGWTQQTHPQPARRSGQRAAWVSCWSASRCIGVGDLTTSAGAVVALAELHT